MVASLRAGALLWKGIQAKLNNLRKSMNRLLLMKNANLPRLHQLTLENRLKLLQAKLRLLLLVREEDHLFLKLRCSKLVLRKPDLPLLQNKRLAPRRGSPSARSNLRLKPREILKSYNKIKIKWWQDLLRIALRSRLKNFAQKFSFKISSHVSLNNSLKLPLVPSNSTKRLTVSGVNNV